MDAELYPRFLENVTAEDMRLGFLVPTSDLSPETLTPLTRLDCDRDIAFVALAQPEGVVRYVADPDGKRVEFGLLVRSDLQEIGLGTGLLRHLISYGKALGVQELTGELLRENERVATIAHGRGRSSASQAGS